MARFGYDIGVVATFNLALVLWPLGDAGLAAHYFERGLALALETNHVPTIAYARFHTCMAAATCRQPSRALPHAQALVDAARLHDLRQWLVWGTFFRGWVRWWSGDPEGASEMRNGWSLLRELDLRVYEPTFGTLLAEVAGDSGEAEAGLEILNAQLETVEQTGARWFHAEAHRVRGEVLLRRKTPDLPGAQAAFINAIQIAKAQQTKTFELRAAISLAKLYQATGRAKAARELLAPAVAGFAEGSELPEVEQANRLLQT
jgi:predicted ATPase